MKIQEWYTGEPSSLEYGRAIDAGRKKLKDKYYPFDVDLWYGNTSSSLNSTGWIICLEFGRGDCYQWIAQKPSTTFGSKELTLYGPMDLDKGEYVETVFDLAEYKDKEVNKFNSIEQVMSYLFTNFSHLRDDDLDEGVDMKILKESSSYCWYAKYFDMKGNKKFVYLSKDITQDAEEAEDMMQEMIREPFTKFVFIGSGYIDTVVDELNATLLESTWSPVEYDEETGEYYSRPGNEFDGIDPQTQPIEEARMSRDPYGINDVKRLLNNKAPEAWWWREEIEMDFGDGSKLANYLTKKGIDVKYNEEDERWFVKGKYNFGDCYFYPYPYRYENELNEGLQYIESINSRKGIRQLKESTDKFSIFIDTDQEPDRDILLNATSLEDAKQKANKLSKKHGGYKVIVNDSNNKQVYCAKRGSACESLNEALGRDYSHIPEVKQINYSNNKNGNLLPYLDCNAFKAALEETGLEAFKIKSARLKGVSLGDLKDEFGGRGMQPWKWTHDFDSSIPMGDGNEFDIFWKGEFPKVQEKLQNEKENTSEEKEDAKLNEEVEVPTLEGPEEGAEYGLSELINAAIQHELETVNEYNVLALNARAEGYDDIASVIDEINTEENKHIGQLQELLKTISPNAQAIVAGETEASDDLVNIEEDYEISTIEFKGKKSFDTEEEAKEFKKSLGDKYKRMYKCQYPDLTFYVVEFDED